MTKMKTSEIFAACIPLIREREAGFICHALHMVAFGDKWTSSWANDDVAPGQDIIMDRLNGSDQLFGTILDIQEGLGVIFGIEHYSLPEFTTSDVRAYRIMWLESLVAEFQQNGD